VYGRPKSTKREGHEYIIIPNKLGRKDCIYPQLEWTARIGRWDALQEEEEEEEEESSYFFTTGL
jgi:hypothetical protein